MSTWVMSYATWGACRKPVVSGKRLWNFRLKPTKPRGSKTNSRSKQLSSQQEVIKDRLPAPNAGLHAVGP